MVTRNRWPWKILFSAIFIDLLIGVIYAWSVFSQGLTELWGWSNVAASAPYSVNQVFYAVSMIAGGFLVDRYGPKMVIRLSALLFAVGMVGSGFSYTPFWMCFFFGFCVGTAVSLSYISALAVCMRWIPNRKRGLVSGLVICAFAMTSVYMSPLISLLIRHFGLTATFCAISALIVPVLLICSCILRDPPPDYDMDACFPVEKGKKVPLENGRDMGWREMLKTRGFWMLFVLMLLVGGNNLAMNSQMTHIIELELGLTQTAIFVSLFSLGNCLIRPFCGLVSDHFPRHLVLGIALLIAASNVFLFLVYASKAAFMVGSVLCGATYGCFITLFPVFTSEFFGTRQFGANYGIVGLSVIPAALAPIIAGRIVDQTGSYQLMYVLFGSLVVIGMLLAFSLKRAEARLPQAKREENLPEQEEA